MSPEIKSMYPQLAQNLIKTQSGSTICCYTSEVNKDGPILTLIHGYPQSAFIWRHVTNPRAFVPQCADTSQIVPTLIDKISLFVPELPGYGVSTPCKKHSKKAVGTALLDAVQSVFHISKEVRRKVILGGHDRGARICHRLAVDKDDFPNLDVIGTIMLDIVPTKAQWEAFSNPTSAVGYFHWPFLANVEIAVNMLEAYGGGRWCRDAHLRIQGSNQDGQQLLAADGAVEVHAELFQKRETLVGSCEDYASGAAPEVADQVEDQENGRKISVPTLVMFSKEKLGSRLDVAEIWKDWMHSPEDLQAIGVGNGHGHYLPEEAAEEVSKAIVAFVQRVS